MPVVTPSGVQPLSLSDYVERLQTRFRAGLGNDLNLDPETPQGQIIAIMALALAELDEAVVDLSNATSVSHASGRQLDDLGTILGLARTGATRSTVTVVLTAGSSGAQVPAGLRVRTANGDVFVSTVPATIPADGEVSVVFEAEDTGPIHASPNSLTILITRVGGLLSATNPTVSDDGRDGESDFDYRTRLSLSTAIKGDTTHDALRAALINGAGVDKVVIEENNTSSAKNRQGLSIGRNAIMCIVLGGQDSDIARVILDTKSPGTGMSGSTSINGAKFERVEETSIVVNLAIRVRDTFPADGASRIRQALLDYSVGRWAALPGQFDRSGFEIGKGVSTDALRPPVQSVPGHDIVSFTVADSDGNALPATTPLNRLYTLEEGDINLTITT